MRQVFAQAEKTYSGLFIEGEDEKCLLMAVPVAVAVTVVIPGIGVSG